MYVCMYVCTYVRNYVYMYVCMYVRMYVCMYVTYSPKFLRVKLSRFEEIQLFRDNIFAFNVQPKNMNTHMGVTIIFEIKFSRKTQNL